MANVTIPLVKVEIIPCKSGYIVYEHRKEAGGVVQTETHVAETMASVARQVSKALNRGRD